MTTELLQRAFEAYDQKNFAGSQALCETFLSSNGDDPSALMLAGLIAKQQSRLEQAIQLLERSVRIAPTANALMNLAQCLWRSDRPEQGLPFIRQVTSTCPLIAEAHLLEATLLYGLRRLDESLRSAQLAQTYLPDSPLVEARLGCIMTEMRRYDDAEVHFWNAAHFMPQLAHCRQISFRHGLWHEIDGHRTAAPAANLPALCEARMSSPYDTVIAVFCEAASFYDCGAAFVNALAQNAGSSLLHFHIIDPDEKSAAFIDEVIAVAGLKNAVVTFEHVQFDDGGDFNRRRVLNACVRFLHLPSLLTTYERAIACVGIDFVFDMPLDSLVGRYVTRGYRVSSARAAGFTLVGHIRGVGRSATKRAGTALFSSDRSVYPSLLVTRGLGGASGSNCALLRITHDGTLCGRAASVVVTTPNGGRCKTNARRDTRPSPSTVYGR